ncbi:MAG: hypothetical protein ABEK59_05225 [Halobacteria archaeon]
MDGDKNPSPRILSDVDGEEKAKIIVEKMLEEKKCVCGAEIKEDDEIYAEFKEVAQELQSEQK